MNTEVITHLKKHCKELKIPFGHLDLIGESELSIQNFEIKIVRDSECESPLDDYAESGKLVCWHRRYKLGHEQPKCCAEDYQIAMIEKFEPGFEEMLERFDHQWPSTRCDAEGLKALAEEKEAKIQARLDKYFVILPLYLYDHGDLSMSTGSFACRWDSGQVGFIYRSKAEIRNTYGWKKLTAKRLEKITTWLTGEVETYDAYLRGDCYGYQVEKDGEEVSACWGFLGPDGEAWAMEAALSEMVTLLEEQKISIFSLIKLWIKHKVPLWKRLELKQNIPVLA